MLIVAGEITIITFASKPVRQWENSFRVFPVVKSDGATIC